MTDIDIAILGASKLGASGSPLWQPVMAIGNDNDDVEGFGSCQAFQSLGVSSMPWPKDSDGYAECLMARNVGGRDAVPFAARDTRSAKVVGKLKPGDTCVHSTGPNQAAQLQLKEEKRQAALLTEDADGFTQLILLDGKAKKVQIVANGAVFEIDKDGAISQIAAGGKAGIICKGDTVTILGTLCVGSGQNPLCLMAGPPTGSTGGITSAPMVAVHGIKFTT